MLSENGVLLLVVLIFSAVLIFGYLFYHRLFMPVMKKRRFILKRMENASSEDDYAFWEGELKLMYLKRIPVIGKIIRKNTDEY